MEFAKVTALLDEICFIFNHAKITDAARLEFFAEKMRDFEDEAYGFMAERFAYMDNFPASLLKALRAVYSDWLKEKRALKNPVDCCKCGGYGLLHYLAYDGRLGYAVEYAGRCPLCENWQLVCGAEIPAITPQKLPLARPFNIPFSPAEELASRGNIF